MQVSLQSLTITDCGSIFAEADFAALAELSLIQKLHIQTDVQVRPQAISQLTCLTLLNSLSLTVAPGDRLNALNYHSHSGFPHAVVSLTALTSLTLSGWTCIGELPESIGMLTALHELLLPNCVATRLPASLQKLTDLERLDFCSNALGR
jgi:Leucine-rich repeat (LRR) protein